MGSRHTHMATMSFLFALNTNQRKVHLFEKLPNILLFVTVLYNPGDRLDATEENANLHANAAAPHSTASTECRNIF